MVSLIVFKCVHEMSLFFFYIFFISPNIWWFKTSYRFWQIFHLKDMIPSQWTNIDQNKKVKIIVTKKNLTQWKEI